MFELILELTAFLHIKEQDMLTSTQCDDLVDLHSILKKMNEKNIILLNI